jgi:oxaloacetate decarboxylase alpha subunit
MLADDLVELFVERLAANGIRVIGSFDGLNDVDNMLVGIRAAKRAGVYVYGALAYSHSPAHTDELFARTAKALVERGNVDAIMIKDSGGLLTPQRVKTLIPALKAVIGKVPLEVHSHCLTGLARQVYVDAVALGADQMHLSIAPLADGPAQPAVQDFDVALDDALIAKISAHFAEIAEIYGKPLGQPMGFDPFHYAHQVPGGMKTNFEFQLGEAGMLGRLDEVLHECARIRAELGWPIMITPFSQLVGTQAVLNVLHGKRYAIVPDEVKKYALGYFGKLVAPVEPNVLDRIVENGSRRIPMTPSLPEPAVPGLRKSYPRADDDELLLRAMFLGAQVDAMVAAGGRDLLHRAQSPVEALREVLAERSQIASFNLSANGTRVEFAR